MPGKKKVSSKKPTRKKPEIALRTDKPKTVQDFFNDKTGELLNPRHEIFAQEWARSFDRRAALKAGKYKDPKTAASLKKQSDNILRREEVQMRIRAILREVVTDMAVTEDWVILEMLDVKNKCLEQKPITARNEDTGEMEVVGYEYNDLRTAMATLREIGINLGMFQKKEDNRANTVIIQMNYGHPGIEPPPEAIEGQSKRLN